MNILDVVQGSEEWHAAREKRFCASEASAAMGLSKYMTRTELLRQKAGGAVPEISAAKQALFDDGHAAEEAARSIVEAQIGDELYPATGTADVEGMNLLASFDGITMAGDRLWECKLYNADLVKQISAETIDDHYWPQLEHQLLVSGAEAVYFTASDGTEANTVGMWYSSVPERRQQVIAAWKQFAEDLKNYTPPEAVPEVLAAPVMALPAVTVSVTGSIAVASNLSLFGEKLKAFIDGLNKKPSTDQEFADAEAAVKTLERAEQALAQARENALGQTASIDEICRTIDLYADMARTNRLLTEKLVKARKEQIRTSIIASGTEAFSAHRDALTRRLGANYLPHIKTDFVGVVKGKRTVASLQDAVDTELARAKIEANAIADKIDANLKVIRAAGHGFLFSDESQLVLKAPDDLAALVKLRVSEHQAAEAKKLEAERERIRVEEAAKAAEAVRKEQEAARKVEPAVVQPPPGKVEPAPAAVQQPPAVARSTFIPTRPAPITASATWPQHYEALRALITDCDRAAADADLPTLDRHMAQMQDEIKAIRDEIMPHLKAVA